MSTRALPSPYAPLALDPHVWARLEKLAEAAGRSVSDLAGAVLRDFIDENERQLAAIDAGIAEADAGKLLDFDEVKAEIKGKLSNLSTKR